MKLPGVLKKLQEDFPGVNQKQSRISRGDQESRISGGLVLGLKISKRCNNKILLNF